MKVIDWINGMFNKYVKIFKDFIAEAFPLAVQAIVGELKEIAVLTVAELQNTDLSSEEKRSQAFQNIKAFALKNGLEARDSIINLVIELAVQKLKAAQ